MDKTAAAAERLWTAPFIKICVTNLLIFVAFHMLMATFAYYVIDVGGTEVTAGLIAGLFAVSSVVIRPIIGWLLDSRGRRLILLLGLAGLVLFPTTYALCSVLGLVMLLRLLHGLFWSASTTASNVIACDVIPKKRFGAGMGFFGLTAAVSTAISPSIGLLLMERQGFRVMFLTAAGFALAGALVALTLRYREPRISGLSFREGMRPRNLFDKRALPAGLTVLVFLLPYGAVTTFLAIYASTEGLPGGGAFFFVMAAASALSRVLSGQIVDRWGEGPIVWLANASMCASLLLLGLAANNVTFFIAAVLFGLAFGTMPPAMQTMALRIVPEARRGAASSTYLCSFDVGMGLGGSIAGLLIKAGGYHAMFALMSLAMVISAALYFFWGRRHPSAFRNARDAGEA
ncbi:MAG: MFS transporter [Firmicutes bacterium]|nr:MFS transporter [Bacillota bacterium]